MPEPKVTPIRFRTLVSAALLGGACTFLALTAVRAFSLVAPEIPWTTPILLLAAAAAGGVMARATYVRNHVNRRPADPKQSVTTLAVARAMLVGGALIAGGYLVFALYFVPQLEASAPRERVIRGLVAAAASIGVVAAGWFAERACRAPDPPDDDAGDA